MAKKTLGIDLGIASVGWCLFATDDDGNPRKIIDLGSYVFDQVEDPKSGQTENVNRRTKRLMRRQRRRRVRRLQEGRKLLKDRFGIDVVSDVIEKGGCIDESKAPLTPFEIKAKGLHGPLSKEELCVALYHYLKHRGFKSNRKVVDDKVAKSSDEGKMLAAFGSTAKGIADLEKKLGRSVYPTEYMIESQKERAKEDVSAAIRNSPASFTMAVRREWYEGEIAELLRVQKEAGTIDDAFVKRYMELWSRQRDFSLGPDRSSPYATSIEEKIGICAFDGRQRAPKDSLSAKRFVLLSSLVNLSYKTDPEAKEWSTLSSKEIEKAEAALVFLKDATYKKLFKTIGIDPSEVFAVRGLRLGRKGYGKAIGQFRKEKGLPERGDIPPELVGEFEAYLRNKTLEAKFYRGSSLLPSLRKMLGEGADDETYDSVVRILLLQKTDDGIANALKDTLSESKVEAVCKLEGAKGVVDLSLELCRRLIPHLRSGMTYDKAMEAEGLVHTKSLSGGERRKMPEIDTALRENGIVLANPVVRNSLVHLRRIVNCIIDKYGFFDDCAIELGRELRKNFADRKAIQAEQLDNLSRNDRLRNEMIESFPNLFPSYGAISRTRGDAFLRYRLYKEQGGVSPYTNRPIDPRDIFTENYEIDHIMPYSRSFDDSLSNKVLVEKWANQEKKNRLPLEWLSGKGEAAPLFAFVSSHAIPVAKKEKLLAKQVPEGFINQDSSDNSYLARIARQLIGFYALPEGKECRSVSGQVTSRLRDLWLVSGKTHSYLSSYEDGLYSARPMSRYRFDGMRLDGETVFFDYFFDGKSALEFKVEKKKADSRKEPSLAEREHNASVSKFIERFDYFQDRFLAAKTNPDLGRKGGIDGLQESIAGERASADFAEVRDAGLYVLSLVRAQIVKDSNQKDRSNHLHHALDAAVIACSTPRAIQRVTRAAQRREEAAIVDRETGEIDLLFPYPEFREEVLVRLYERNLDKMIEKLNALDNYRDEPATAHNVHVVIPARTPKKNVAGALSKETIMGVSIDGNTAVARTPVDKLTLKNVDDIEGRRAGSKVVYEASLAWLKAGKPTKFPVLPNGRPVKSVRLRQGSVENMVDLSNGRFAANAECVRVEVYRKKEGADALYFVPIYYHQILARKAIEKGNKKEADLSYNLMWAAGSEGRLQVSHFELTSHYSLQAILPRQSLVEITSEGKNGGRFLAYSGGATGGLFEVYSPLGDDYDLAADGNLTIGTRHRLSISTISTIKLRSISPLGWVS